MRYRLVDGVLKKKRVHVWLVKGDGGALGALYWEDMVAAGEKQPRVKQADCCMPVNTISDVYIGKQTPLFQRPELKEEAQVPVDCCLSIVSANATLDLAAKYPKVTQQSHTASLRELIACGHSPVCSHVACGSPGPQGVAECPSYGVPVLWQEGGGERACSAQDGDGPAGVDPVW